ncbi:unnamed protein product [Tetraodon nigroviridis]|uniref:(spotted green pufferfish) hypothetical protein n=1 Tax=Tetraodon nigroviridis TaxID=99883 RepID=Q4SM95_TETNG|nr:unnamed protein product [Tetraodon nigroviridis]
MARLNWCLAAVISWGKFLFACFFPLRGAKRDTVSPGSGGQQGSPGAPYLYTRAESHYSPASPPLHCSSYRSPEQTNRLEPGPGPGFASPACSGEVGYQSTPSICSWSGPFVKSHLFPGKPGQNPRCSICTVADVDRSCRGSQPDELEGVHTHTFKLKPFKKAKSCDICKQAITKEGLICKGKRPSTGVDLEADPLTPLRRPVGSPAIKSVKSR